jgi:hypothetical protein
MEYRGFGVHGIPRTLQNVVMRLKINAIAAKIAHNHVVWQWEYGFASH